MTTNPQSSISSLQQAAKPILAPKPGPAQSALQAVGQAAPLNMGSQQEGLGKLVQSAVTGKAVGPSTGPQASQKAAQLQQTQLAQQAQNQDVAQQQQEDEQWLALDDQEFQTREKAIEVKQQISNQLETLLTQYEQNKGQLNFDKMKAQAEQLGFLARLSSDKYVTKLKNEGARARLDTNAGFKEAMMNAAFQNQQQLLNESFRLRGLLRADGRDFEKQLAQMDIETAIQVLEAEMDAEKEGMFYQGLQGLVSAGAQGYGAYKANKASTTQQNLDNADKYGQAGGGSDDDPSTSY
jgi:hypothetical protein